MALTVTIATDGKSVFGNKHVRMGVITFDDSYPTDGESYTAAMFALGKIRKLFVFPRDGYMPDVDDANSKIKVYGTRPDSTSSGVQTMYEVGNTENLSAISFDFIVFGIGG